MMTPILFIALFPAIFSGIVLFRQAALLARRTSGLDLFAIPRLTIMWLELCSSLTLLPLLAADGWNGLKWLAVEGFAFSVLFSCMNLRHTNLIQAVACGILQGMTGALGAIVIRLTPYSRPLEAYAVPNYPMSPVARDHSMPEPLPQLFPNRVELQTILPRPEARVSLP